MQIKFKINIAIISIIYYIQIQVNSQDQQQCPFDYQGQQVSNDKIKYYEPDCQNMPGYFWDRQQCLPCKNKNCYCTDIDQCTSCIDEYYLDKEQNDCKKCPQGCKKCCQRESVAQLVCTECNYNYLLLNGACIHQPFCDFLTQEGTCRQCRQRSYLKQGIKCQTCHSSCQMCITDYKCEKCREGYYQPEYFQQSDQLYCLKCSTENCSVCDNKGEKCEECRQQYYLDNINNVCKKCCSMCKQCQSSQKCEDGQCKEISYQHNGCVFPCRKQKGKFCGGSWYNNVYDALTGGDLGCWRDGRIETRKRVFECQFRNRADYSVDQCVEACRNGIDNGTKCDLYDKTQYQGIDTPTYKFSGLQFFGECFCTNSDYQIYGTGDGNQCEHCKTTVTRFGTQVLNCKMCEIQKIFIPLDQNLCLDIDCKDVKQTRPVCIECEDGYYLDEYNDCKACKDNAKKCVTYEKIIQCNEGYLLVKDSKEQYLCAQNSEKYNCRKFQDAVDFENITEDEIGCMDCLPYKLLRDPDDNSQIKSTTQPLQYYYRDQDKICQLCLIENCNQCFSEQETNKQMCEQCEKKHYISEGATQCIPCQENCLECEKLTGFCLVCKDGYRQNSSTKQCEKCEIENCIDCSKQKDFCDVCAEGFGVKDAMGSQCIKCQQGCAICDLQIKKCKSCIQGYFWDKFICKPYPKFCLKTGHAGRCILCQHDYESELGFYQSYRGSCVQCSYANTGTFNCPQNCDNINSQIQQQQHNLSEEEASENSITVLQVQIQLIIIGLLSFIFNI